MDVKMPRGVERGFGVCSLFPGDRKLQKQFEHRPGSLGAVILSYATPTAHSCSARKGISSPQFLFPFTRIHLLLFFPENVSSSNQDILGGKGGSGRRSAYHE